MQHHTPVRVDTPEDATDVTNATCKKQPPQPFLIRINWFKRGSVDEIKEGRELFQKSLKYRTEQYGYYRGFGKAEWNSTSPGQHAVKTTFFDRPLVVHKKIVPALKCVEKTLREKGFDKLYRVGGVGGIRYHNTYHGGEVSNHVYGIAMDIDSDRNTCCGCVGDWNKHPLCRKKAKTVYDRTALPREWVETFEEHGFYWLGHDPMQDTMHFEFLGDPDKVIAPKANVSVAGP